MERAKASDSNVNSPPDRSAAASLLRLLISVGVCVDCHEAEAENRQHIHRQSRFNRVEVSLVKQKQKLFTFQKFYFFFSLPDKIRHCGCLCWISFTFLFCNSINYICINTDSIDWLLAKHIRREIVDSFESFFAFVSGAFFTIGSNFTSLLFSAPTILFDSPKFSFSTVRCYWLMTIEAVSQEISLQLELLLSPRAAACVVK